MKKRILSILLILCMVLALCPVTAFADENYMITQNFKYGTRTYDGTDPQTSPYQFVIPAGGSFGLATIEDCSPYELVGWKETGSGTVYPPYGEIENLSSDLTFDAVYQVQGGLTITVDGFMPGNTPNDCTVTMESTIPGITFSEDDIQYIRWDKYAADGDRYPVTNNDAFQAGTRYKCFIDLDSNGLTEVPVVTVNGNTPDYCTLPYFAGVPEKLSIGCDLGTPVAPTLAVTVDNFEAGKKLSDCTFSFETTNLGVTFSESDILGVTWEYYDSYAEDFYIVDGTNVLQDIDYRVTIELDSKGLTEAPAVTVNGKTPESCEIVTSGGKTVLRITCELGAPLAQQLTISGPLDVCKDQDYEFSVTAAEGAEVLYFLYRCGEYGGDTAWSRVEDGVYYGTVPASEYGDADSMVLTVYGTAASGKPATATKTVRISKEHHFIDGVCLNCGAKPEYTITYDGGEGVEGSIADGIKTHGDNFTLSRDTFTRAGYEQTGWATSDGGEKVYDLGGTYTENKDITLYPVWSDIENPKIIGIEDGKTYCSAQTVTVSDNDAIKEVTVNGTAVNFDANNQFILPANGEQTIVAMDKAGNKKTVTVTVNNGHTAGNDDGNCSTPVYCIYHPDTVVVAAKSHDFSGEWHNDGTGHWHICQNDGCTVAETETPHSCTDDGDCTTAVVCECGYVITAANAKHTYGEWQSNSDDTHTRYCTVEGCNGYEDGNCAGGEATCVAKAVCDTCKAEYGEIDSANHNLEKIPAKDATVTETGNTEYWHCQDCGKYFADENGTKEIKLEDTIISKLSPEIIEGKGQSITAGEKKELIFKSNAAFSDFIRVELDGKTLDEKNYTVKEGSTVVTLKADYVATLSAGEHTIGIVSESGTATTTFTVNAKAVVDNDTKSPQTGDNSHMALWIALLFMSGAGVIGTMVYGKKKRAK